MEAVSFPITMPQPLDITVITPTTGKPSLDRLIAGIDGQPPGGTIFHLLLWDQMRDAAAKSPES